MLKKGEKGRNGRGQNDFVLWSGGRELKRKSLLSSPAREVSGGRSDEREERERFKLSRADNRGEGIGFTLALSGKGGMRALPKKRLEKGVLVVSS